MKFEIKGKDFLLDGKPFKIISGAVHYFRNLPDTWDDIFDKLVALGCNCVETYCVWNMHEKEHNVYDFSDVLDVSTFLEKAQKHGLLAIVRPGPYICAEWEFGGLPWWLQTITDMEIRCDNVPYMQCFADYLSRLFDEVRPHLVSNGGNVIMMQVENEYGYYGDDKEYLAKLAKVYRDNGIDVPLFTSDGTKLTDLLDGTIDGCLPTLNFGSRVEESFVAHDKLFPDVPKMCMEMWNGWFDAWGEDKHHTTSADDYAKTVDDMLTRGSVNMYMFIGGTNFGFTSGANHYETFAPDVTSYDYDALLTECGDVTPKYIALREIIARHTGKNLLPVPSDRPKAAYGKVYVTESTGLFENIDNLSSPIRLQVPMCMEYCNAGYGYLVYKSTLNRNYDNAKLTFSEIGDRAQVYVGNNYVGTVYVNNPPYEVTFSAKTGDVLAVVCENMGRANFGPKMMRKKGIVGRTLIDGKIHFGWQAYPLPMDNLDRLQWNEKKHTYGEIFYKFAFDIAEKPCDTFLRTDNFTKGFAVLNGFNLGRFWTVGPQRTLYVPRSLLRRGANELIVFDSDGVQGCPMVEFTDKPDLG